MLRNGLCTVTCAGWKWREAEAYLAVLLCDEASAGCWVPLNDGVHIAVLHVRARSLLTLCLGLCARRRGGRRRRSS